MSAKIQDLRESGRMILNIKVTKLLLRVTTKVNSRMG